MNKDSVIFVAQNDDLIGAAIAMELKNKEFINILTYNKDELDLTDASAVFSFFEKNKPEYVFCFAGPHGGITMNTQYPADLIYTNLQVQCNLIHSAYKHGVKKFLFMASSCVYPKECPQPIAEDYYMTGKMEPTSIAYSTARVAGIEMCLAYNRQHKTKFIPSIMTNYFGPGDDFSDDGHVLASVLRKMSQAKERGDASLTLWGSGKPKRQFMFTHDIAKAAILIMQKYNENELINIAGGKEFSIAELANELKEITGYQGEILFDTSKPDGAMRKLLDNNKLKLLGFAETVDFHEGLSILHKDFILSQK
ncbi:MAG: NAD-dependent epimerase/dehydratase family protein [Defluviitaleaceae bacterium]|nr:NAD-dependent epimerase/dehydratase family protein [Defluviitaleaceae bacterium]MCL2238343.1 NAD-dependent epimerase/dehydratase family protein [Defluviitaleaceae bacterium]